MVKSRKKQENKREIKIDPTFHMVKSKEEQPSKEYKEYRKKWNENPKNYVVGDFPIHLDIETMTSCNLKCFMCYQSYDPPKPCKMDAVVFKRIIDEGEKKGLCSIKTQYRGEPLLDKRMPELIKYAKDHGVIEVMLNTNATLLDEKTAKALIKAGTDKIICSVDGYTKDVYENVRIGANFETVLENIKRLQRLKKEKRLKKPIVRVQMVDTPRNHQQIKGYIKFWSKIAEQVAIEEMLDWNVKEEDSSVVKDFVCAQLWQRLIILADGSVLPCCRAMRGGNEKLEVVGNVHKESIENIWKGKKMSRLRELHKEGRSHEIKMCRLCGLRKAVVNKKRK